jgi:hypothetical protein
MRAAGECKRQTGRPLAALVVEAQHSGRAISKNNTVKHKRAAYSSAIAPIVDKFESKRWK